MKLTGLLMMTVWLQVSFSGNAQTVNFSGNDVPLKKALASIRRQTGTFFFYDASQIKDAKPVTADLKNVPMQTALNEILKEQSLSWILEERTVTIIRKAEKINGPPISQTRDLSSTQVNGLITDAEGKPIGDVRVPILDGITPLQRQYLSDNNKTTTIRYSNTLTLASNRGDFGPGA